MNKGTTLNISMHFIWQSLERKDSMFPGWIPFVKQMQSFIPPSFSLKIFLNKPTRTLLISWILLWLFILLKLFSQESFCLEKNLFFPSSFIQKLIYFFNSMKIFEIFSEKTVYFIKSSVREKHPKCLWISAHNMRAEFN